MHNVIVSTDIAKGKISRHIYGHFAEHLGRCIYEGIWVGEDSPIPNTKGIRNDVLEALKRIKVPVLRWPGGLLCRRIPLEGRHRPERKPEAHGEHALGRRGRKQPFRDA